MARHDTRWDTEREWDMEAILRHYGVDVQLGTMFRKVHCVSPDHSDSHASAGASVVGYRCHTCGLSGDGIKLIMEVEHVDFAGAVALYEDWTGDSHHRVSKPVTRKSWGVDPFESRDQSTNDSSFQAGVRRQPDLWS